MLFNSLLTEANRNTEGHTLTIDIEMFFHFLALEFQRSPIRLSQLRSECLGQGTASQDRISSGCPELKLNLSLSGKWEKQTFETLDFIGPSQPERHPGLWPDEN
ncbi:hypothetical protein [Fulvimarina sp. MAC3]|uniref:hypothetical protein n=1 Tax=Fulvimarina sp. MAC3 TaxID=3148887 RepID=UPI0031FC31DA